jgi:hypothetical protein
MQERLDRIGKQITAQKLSASATNQPRYAKFISYKAVSIDSLPVAPGTAGAVGGTEAKKPEEKKEEPKKRGFGLGKLPLTGGGEQKQANVMASGGARGVDPEVKAKGGDNPKLVTVNLTPADIAAFKKEGGLS